MGMEIYKRPGKHLDLPRTTGEDFLGKEPMPSTPTPIGTAVDRC